MSVSCRICVAAFLSLIPAFSKAAVIHIATPNASSTGGQPVNASATIITSPNHVQVILTNLQANPTSVVQCISGFEFHLTTGQNAGTLISSIGTERDVADNETFTIGSTGSTGWGLQTVGANLKLNALGFTAPDSLIIGPPGGGNLYSNANGSISGNGPHNPFLGLTATYELNVPGVTAASGVNNTIFHFNTSTGNSVLGVDVPEPITLSALMLVIPFYVRRKA